MARAVKRLADMRRNPRDWKIRDVETVCRHYGLRCTPPKRGDHYKVRHPAVAGVLTIPAHRPIKSVYIKRLVAMIDAVQEG